MVEQRPGGGISGGIDNIIDPKKGSSESVSQTSEQQLRLEMLIVSNDRSYRESGTKCYTPCTTSEGSTLFNIITATRDELAKSFESNGNGDIILRPLHDYHPDIFLFDLRGDLNNLNQGLSLLENYLLRNKRCYTIVSTDRTGTNALQNDRTWKNLQSSLLIRGVGQFAFDLTRRTSLLDSENYENYFRRLLGESLNDTHLLTIRNLKAEPKRFEVAISIPCHPTDFRDFSKEVREQYITDLVKKSLDRMASFNPDETREMLRVIQPANYRYSVPQHGTPPFEDLVDISPEEVIPIIQGQLSGPLSRYIHIPFCPGKDPCTFCDYWTIRGNKEAQKYITLLKKEWEMYYKIMGSQAMSLGGGAHIGGGTPSMLPPELIKQLDEFVKGIWFTFEVGPSTTTPEKLEAFKELGATRTSIGIQSTNESFLRRFGRWFGEDAGKRSLKMLLEYWPKTTNIDLMYGLPGQTIDSWERDLETVLELGVPSITVYELRESSRTRFPPGQQYPKLYERMLQRIMATERSTSAGYKQISNNQFVKSVEDQPYVYRDSKKRGGNTLGIGGSSYSMFPGIVYFNIGGKDPHDDQTFEEYSKKVESGILPVEIGKLLDSREQMTQFMIQGLKLSGVGKNANGVDMVEFERRFGQPVFSGFPIAAMLQSHGFLEEKDTHMGLTYKGLAFESLVLKTFYQRH